MGYRCYLCNKKKLKDNPLVLHRFPKEDWLRKKWLSACCLNEKDEVNSLSICSDHFLLDDYKKLSSSRRKLLNENAVPSLFVPNPPKPDGLSLSLDNRDVSSNEMKEIENRRETDCSRITKSNVQTTSLTVEKPEAPSNNSLLPSVYDTTKKSNKRTFHDVEANENNRRINELNSNSENILYEEKLDQTPKKQRYTYPSHISQITTRDVATPKRASRIITFINQKFREKNKKIQSLQKRVSRLKNRIQCLEDLVKHLQDKNILSANAGNSLLVIIG